MVLAQAIEAVGNPSASGEEPNVLYMYLLEACEKVFENELDQATFEEHMRWFFGSKVIRLILVRRRTCGGYVILMVILSQAYQVFTFDRVITAIIKQVSGRCLCYFWCTQGKLARTYRCRRSFRIINVRNYGTSCKRADAEKWPVFMN